MYSITIQPQDGKKPTIKRSMVADNESELATVIAQVCKERYDIVAPLVLFVSNGTYKVFDFTKPLVVVDITKIGGHN